MSGRLASSSREVDMVLCLDYSKPMQMSLLTNNLQRFDFCSMRYAYRGTSGLLKRAAAQAGNELVRSKRHAQLTLPR